MTRLQQRLHGFIWLFLGIALIGFAILALMTRPPIITADAPAGPALELPASEAND